MNDKQKRLRTRKTLLGILGVVFLLALPFAVTSIYRRMTELPEQIVIATGPQGGLYRELAENLQQEIEQQLKVDVTLEHETHGSLDNLRLLRAGKVDFALYQPGTAWVLHPKPGPNDAVRPAFVANVYPEVTHWFVRHDSDIAAPTDLVGKTVAIGEKTAGDYAMSQVLLEHLGLTEQDIVAEHLSYADIRKRFQDGSLDAAFVTLGTRADILTDLAEDGTCLLLPIPNAEAFTRKYVLPTLHTIPAGMYDSFPAPFPPHDVQTIALRANLLTHEGVDENLVEEVTRILHSKEFVWENHLSELSEQGDTFATSKPEFAVHPGASSYYDPELKPLLPTEFVEGTEGIRSFLVSSLIAVFLFVQWYRRRARRRKEHWLDQCIQSLLEIERRQLELDQKPGAHDLARLQKLLDEVTELRQRALRKVSAHDLSDDRAADCFLEMCHALSDKINAKITRQRLEQQFEELGKRLGEK